VPSPSLSPSPLPAVCQTPIRPDTRRAVSRRVRPDSWAPCVDVVARRGAATRVVWGLGLALLLGLGGRVAVAGGANTIGFNPRSVARGGADTAVGADGPTAAIRNPALLLGSYGLRIDGNFGFLLSRTRYTNPRNDTLGTSGPSPVPSFGIAWDPFAPTAAELQADPTLPLDSRFRVGIVGFPIIGGGGESELKTSIFPEGETEAINFFIFAIGPVFAFEVSDTLSLGFSPQLLLMRLSTEGLVGSLSGFSKGRVRRHRTAGGSPLNPPEPVLVSGQQVSWSEMFGFAGTDDASASTRIEVGEVYGVGFTGSLGLWWNPSPMFSLGASYQPEGIVPTAKGKAKLDANRALSNVSPTLQNVLGLVLESLLPDEGQSGFQGDYDIELKGWRTPSILSLGIAVRPVERWLIALDLRYTFWKQAFNQIEITMTGGTSADINEINGESTVRSTNKLKWRNSIGVGLGTSVAVTDWCALRLGYSYSQNPITSGHTSPTSGITEHGVGFGAGFFFERWEFDIAYFHAFATNLRVEKSLDLVEWDDTVFKTEQHWIYLGASYQF